MPSDIPETKNTPYTIRHDWSVLAADVWMIVELTVPPPTQDAGGTDRPEAVNPQEAETLRVTSAVSGIKSEGVEGHLQAEGTSTEKNKENCQMESIEAKPGCELHFSYHLFSHWQLNPHYSMPFDFLN
jgi:hypothetical protein